MLRREQNDLLTQPGPGTPGGRLFRSYWLPVLLSEELPENDSPPVRVKILSERLLAFRDSDGRLGLVDEFCAHRGVSLWFARNEQSGLRCAYHGWKYDVTGQCIDVPSERTPTQAAAVAAPLVPYRSTARRRTQSTDRI
jgi:phthalate 4,5-dioxygenase oxygenase subunit